MARTHSRGKGGGGGQKKGPRPVKRSDSKLTRWNTIDDIPMDEVDEFHASRDKILLEGNGRGGADDDDDDMDDEVFALKGLSRDSDDDEDEGHYGEQYDDEDEDLEDLPAIEEKEKKKKKKSKKSKGKKKDEDSDEEKDSEPEEEGWGRGKAAYYADNADELESDDEEARELELQEARRLQLKQRSSLQDGDFGLEDNTDVAPGAEQDDFSEPIPVVVPTALPTEKKDILRHLEKTNPESLALARDWVDAANELYETQARIAKIEAEDPDAMSLGMVHIHYQTLLSYCTCVAFYIYLRSTPKYAQRPALLQDHPVMKRLLTLKQSLSTLEALDFAASDDDDEEDEFGLGGMELDQNALWKFARQQGLEPNELLELLQDAKADGDMDEEDELEDDDDDVIIPSKPPKKKRKTSANNDELDEPAPKKTKSKSKSKSQPQPPTPVFDLVEPEFVPSSSSSSKLKPPSVMDTFGEASQLDQADAADKSARKKSLRFHTSKIESASARRHGARNQAIGGDDDLPYRDRKKEKDAKLIKEAAKRGNEGGADLDDEDPEPSLAGSKRDRESDDDASDSDGGDGYYELVKKQNKEKKEKKKAEYEEFHGRSRLDEEEDATGPRSLTRAILKNKGLTPHRPKAVRNPRVKKRQKYEQAKKQEASRKAVFKGGLAATGGRYDGELSGISKVVKSVRLG